MKHPAKFSDEVLGAIARRVPADARNLLDPFAGVGRIHEIGDQTGVLTIGVELEPEWADVHERTLVANALELPLWWSETFDVIATSPTYANRMADHHEARDGSVRRTYRHTLGRPLHPDNSGQLQWGEKYRAFHKRAWQEALRVLRPGGVFILNVSSHVRGGKFIPVAEWHIGQVASLGLEVIALDAVETKRFRHGENREKRVPYEVVATFQKAA